MPIGVLLTPPYLSVSCRQGTEPRDLLSNAVLLVELIGLSMVGIRQLSFYGPISKVGSSRWFMFDDSLAFHRNRILVLTYVYMGWVCDF